MQRARFEALVAQATDALPKDVVEKLDNVAICVEADSEEGDRLGEFVGIAQVDRLDYTGVLPDRIVLYQDAIEDECGCDDPKLIAEEIRRTLWHEIAHHFGWEEDDVHEAEERRGWCNQQNGPQ